MNVSNPGGIEQVVDTAQDQILMGWFDIDVMTHGGKAPASFDQAQHDDDAALAVIVNAGAGDGLLTVSSAGHDDVAVSGGSTSPTPWSLSFEDPSLVVINTADAGAVVKTGCPRSEISRGVIVNRGGAAMNPPPVQPDPDGSGCGNDSCDPGCLTFTVMNFGATTMSVAYAVDTDFDADGFAWGWCWS